MEATVKKVNVQIKMPKCSCHTTCDTCHYMDLSDRNGRDCWCSFYNKYYEPTSPACSHHN